MIQSNKIFRAHSGCWDYASTDDPKYTKKPIFKHFFFHTKPTKKPDLMEEKKLPGTSSN
jgi:hypothetical protein